MGAEKSASLTMFVCPLRVQRVVIYPHYINAVKTVSEGRRIPKQQGEDFSRRLSHATADSYLLNGSL